MLVEMTAYLKVVVTAVQSVDDSVVKMDVMMAEMMDLLVVMMVQMTVEMTVEMMVQMTVEMMVQMTVEMTVVHLDQHLAFPMVAMWEMTMAEMMVVPPDPSVSVPPCLVLHRNGERTTTALARKVGRPV